MFSKDALWSIAGGGVPAVAALISIPWLISFLGYELFALTSLLISLTIFFYIYDFGIGRSMVFFTPKPDYAMSGKLDSLIGTALISALFLAFVSAGLLWFIAPFLVRDWLHVPVSFFDQAILAFQLAALTIIPSLLANVFKGILEGHSKFKEANLCKMFSGAGIFLAPLIVVVSGSYDLVIISIALLLSRVVALLLYVFLSLSLMQLSALRFRTETFHAIFKYSLWAGLSAFISTMFVYGDRFVVARYLDSEHLSLYIASQDILIRYLLIPWSMAMVLMPVFAAGSLSKSESRDMYRKQEKHVGYLSLLVTILVFFALLAVQPFMDEWGIPKVAIEIVMIQIVGIFFCAIAQLPLIYLYARGRPRLITMIYSAEALIYVLIAPAIFMQYGITGACLVWSGRLVLEYLLLKTFVEREMKRNLEIVNA